VVAEGEGGGGGVAAVSSQAKLLIQGFNEGLMT